MKLTAVIYQDKATDWLVAKCPEVGVASQGKSTKDALVNLKEASELYLESFPEAHPKTAKFRRFELTYRFKEKL